MKISIYKFYSFRGFHYGNCANQWMSTENIETSLSNQSSLAQTITQRSMIIHVGNQ